MIIQNPQAISLNNTILQLSFSIKIFSLNDTNKTSAKQKGYLKANKDVITIYIIPF